MQFDIIHTLPEMDTLSEEWDSLLLHSASHVPFLRHAYMRAWWQSLGGGEWQEGELNLVTARAENGSLVGIAPLFFTHNRQGEPALMFLGSIEISDYLDVIASPEHLPNFINGLLDFLVSPHAPAWKVLDLYNFLDNSLTLPLLESSGVQKGLSYSKESLQHCPYIPLPDSWDDYLGGIDKKQRHEIRRKMRRAEEYPIPLRWYIVEDEKNLDEGIDGFLDLMAFDPPKKRFLTSAMRIQFHETMQMAFRQGWLQLAFVEIGGEKAAAYCNFDYMNRIWVYNSGFNPNYWELSLGWVLLGHLLHWAIDHKREAYDFMRGEEDYKYRFGAVDRRVIRAMIRR